MKSRLNNLLHRWSALSTEMRVTIVGSILAGVFGLLIAQSGSNPEVNVIVPSQAPAAPASASVGALPAPTLPALTPTVGRFVYRVLVQAEDNLEFLANARVTLVTEGYLEPLDQYSDSVGLISFELDDHYRDQRARLIIDADGYQRYERQINLRSDSSYTVRLLPLSIDAAAPIATLQLAEANPGLSYEVRPPAVRSGNLPEQAARTYLVRETYDGFVSVRQEPHTSSPEIKRIAPGAVIACEQNVVGERIENSDSWAFCGSAGGYIFAQLLTEQTAAPVSIASCGSATVVGVAELNIRSEPTLGGSIVGALRQGTSVEVLCNTPVPADGRTWLRVRASGLSGWMSERFLQRTDEDRVAANCGRATVVDVAALAVRSQPTLSGQQTGVVAKGASVELLCDQPVQADDRTWLRIQAGDLVGWMSERFLQVERN